MRLTVALLLLTFQCALAQDTKLVIKRSGIYKEEFDVLAKDKKVRQGDYKRFKNENEIISEGRYENNERVGEWKFYLNGVVDQVYDYSSKKLTFLKEADYSLRYIGNDKLTNLPLYIGGKEGLNADLSRLMHYPGQAVQLRIEGKVSVEFILNEDNSISNVLISRGIGGGCDEVLWNALKKLDTGWLTGSIGNQRMKCKMTLSVQFILRDKEPASIVLI